MSTLPTDADLDSFISSGLVVFLSLAEAMACAKLTGLSAAGWLDSPPGGKGGGGGADDDVDAGLFPTTVFATLGGAGGGGGTAGAGLDGLDPGAFGVTEE